MMRVAVILPAAGLGTCMQKASAENAGISRKQFMLLDGVPILVHTVRKFAACPQVSEIVVALRQEDLEWVDGLLKREHARGPIRGGEGGNSRQQSVENAFSAIDSSTDLVAVHDAVRPFVELETIGRAIEEAASSG